MVQTETNLVVADNSGARSVRIFRLYGGSKRKSANIGDIVLCAVKDASEDFVGHGISFPELGYLGESAARPVIYGVG